MHNMEATGHKVSLYSDVGCFNKIGQVTKDSRCYSAPSDVSDLGHELMKLHIPSELTENPRR